jgi:hypothetical protein
MPSSFAIAVMRVAKASSVSATFSASATAASLADATMVALMAWRTVMVWPGRKPKRTGCWLAACCETLILSSNDKRPASISDRAT